MKKTIIFLFLFVSSLTYANDEISLFNSAGKPVAYVAEDLTIYLWSGKPVAYLVNKSDKFHVYGFNGKHLGWFIKGAIFGHKGKATGAVKERFSGYTSYEPYKSYKQYKPYKNYKQYAPYQPYLSNSWSDISLKLFLLQGAK
jgi:hypothetical protein